MGRKKLAAMVMWRDKLTDILSRGIRRAHVSVPWGVRSLLGLVLMIGGLLGFLPVLGFWMVPLGAVLIALDIPPFRRRLVAWSRRHRRRG